MVHGGADQVSAAARILADQHEDGETISRKTVAKTMRQLGLRGICPKRWKTTTVTDTDTDTDTDNTYPYDAVNRTWDTGTLNTVRVDAITCPRT